MARGMMRRDDHMPRRSATLDARHNSSGTLLLVLMDVSLFTSIRGLPYLEVQGVLVNCDWVLLSDIELI